jgi:hypothetical protein
MSILVDHVPTLLREGRATLFARLEELRDELSEVRRTQLWKSMRAEVAKNREFKTAVWALPDNDLERLNALAEAYRPTEAVEQYRFLFDEPMPRCPASDRSEGLANVPPPSSRHVLRRPARSPPRVTGRRSTTSPTRSSPSGSSARRWPKSA